MIEDVKKVLNAILEDQVLMGDQTNLTLKKFYNDKKSSLESLYSLRFSMEIGVLLEIVRNELNNKFLNDDKKKK